MRIWDAASGQGRALQGHTDSVNSVVFSPDGQQLALGGSDQTVRVWDVQTGTCLQVINVLGNISKVAWQGHYLLFGCDNGGLWCWLLKSQGQTLQAHLQWRTGARAAALMLEGCQVEGVQGISPLNVTLVKQRGAIGTPASSLSKGESQPAVSLAQHPASFVAQIGAKTGTASPQNNNNTSAPSQPQTAMEPVETAAVKVLQPQ